MKRIRVTTDKSDYVGLEIFDYLLAYSQWHSDYNHTLDIELGDPTPQAFNIAFVSMPQTALHDLDHFDIVILDNADEAFGRGTEHLYHALFQFDNSYLACNSILHPEHPQYAKLNPRIITSMICWHQHRRTYIDPVYAPSYEFNMEAHNVGSLVYINGRNRSWRECITQLLQQHAPEVPHHNIINNSVVSETKFSWHEDQYDTAMRIQCNDSLVNQKHNNLPPDQRWPALPAGVRSRFGEVEFHDRFFDAFRHNAVIVYPESTWQNNVLSLTEKSLRCFLHQRWAMPFGGANIHALFRNQGFETAWSLLPKGLQQFDQCLDHKQRWQQQAQAVQWLAEHPEVFDSDHARNVLLQNKAQCIVWSSPAGKQLWNIIYEKTRY